MIIMGALRCLFITCIKLIVFIWAFHTSWIYTLFSIGASTQKKIRSKLTHPIKECDTQATFVPCSWQKTPYIISFENEKFETVVDIWAWSVRRYGDQKLLGTRSNLENIQEEYNWMTYSEVDDAIQNLGLGLRALGQQPNHRVCLFAETRAEWMIAAQACFRHNLTVVTVNATLGMEGILHCLVETEVSTVITSASLLPKFRTLLQTNKTFVKTIVFMENPLVETEQIGYSENVQIVSFRDTIALGIRSVNNRLDPIKPTSDSIAIIMYTSGSTGTPKGVMITQKNIVAQISSTLYCLNLQPEDLYIAYLPLSHILEFVSENLMLASGVGIGYSHPNTLLDISSKVASGCKGDATILRPHIMFCVPLVLDRMYKGIQENIHKKSSFTQDLIEFCIDYKAECSKRGEITPIIDRLVFRKIRNTLGGRMCTIVSGGAPLSSETHDYLRTVLGVTLHQGLGLTEIGVGSVMDCHDLSSGRVGTPLEGTHLRLVNWDEGNYRVTDQPLPRGEIYFGGDNVAHGYFELEEKTKEDFFTDTHNRRWFKTGDIGEVEDDGTLRIIDRKKDIVKLQNGEYVSLRKVESILKGCPVVGNICVFGDALKTFVVALIFPQVEIITELHQKCKKGKLCFEDLCNDKDIIEQVQNKIKYHGNQTGLQKYEIPAAITLTPVEWSQSNGMTTATMKLKRFAIQKHYQDSLDKMYAE